MFTAMPVNPKNFENANRRPSFSAKTKKHKQNLPPTKPRNIDARTREYLTPDEVKKLKVAAKNATRHGFRDWLLITMMYRHAFRAGEVGDLKWDQVDLKRARLHVNRLKNGDPSVHYLEGDEIRALRQLQRDYPSTDHVFVSQRQGPLTNRSLHHIIAQAGELAGFEFSVHPHMLRHSKGYQLANKGEDTRAIQAYLGHKNIQHTVLYTKLDAKRFKDFGKD